MGVDNPGLVGNAALRKRDIDGLELSMNELTNAPGLEYVGKSYPKLWFLSLAGNQMRGEVSLGGMFRGLACPGLGEKHPQWDVVAAVAHVGFIRRSVDYRTTIGSVWGLAEWECLSGDELSGRVDVSQLLLSLRALRLSLNFLSGNIDLNFLSGNIDLSNLPPLMESLSLSLSWSVEWDCGSRSAGFVIGVAISFWRSAEWKFGFDSAAFATEKGLDVSENQLSGTADLSQVPRSWEFLNSYWNEFGGNVDLTRLPSTLESVGLDNNQLGGSLSLMSLPAVGVVVYFE